MKVEIYESLLPGWPVGDLGASVSGPRGDRPARVIVRQGQTKSQRRRAIASAKVLIRHLYGSIEAEAKTEVAA